VTGDVAGDAVIECPRIWSAVRFCQRV
jgi:hypothetical protein